MRCAALLPLLALLGERAIGLQHPWDEEGASSWAGEDTDGKFPWEKPVPSLDDIRAITQSTARQHEGAHSSDESARELPDGRLAPDPPRDDIWAPTNSSAWQHTARLNAPPKRVAIAYRGDYHRRVLLEHAVEYSEDPDVENSSVAYGCSDFFHNAEQHWQNLVAPLEAAGASVKTYFHSYRDVACPQRDARLVRELRPRRHEWSRAHLELIVDSYLRVLELVLEDEDDLDAVVLTRFDLRYREPITAFDIDWSVTNVAHREGELSWLKQRKLSDLFYVLPIGHVQPLMEALRVSGTDPPGHKATGAGHWIWHPFTEAMGKESLRFIDQQFSPSFSSPSETPSFVGISRRCGADYDECSAAE